MKTEKDILSGLYVEQLIARQRRADRGRLSRRAAVVVAACGWLAFLAVIAVVAFH
jgi:hypothetical protein